MTATFHVGDAIEVMNTLPEKSVDLIISSPPFLALRSYLPADHPDKALEGGSQTTPGEYIDWLIDVVEACDRVLAPHGSMCIELGDTYAGSGGGGGDYLEGGWREGQAQFAGSAASMKEPNAAHWRQNNSNTSAWPLPKSLSLIPELFRLTLVYGTNPLTGRTTERWRLRNVVRWVRPNPPVGALGDKWRPATSELMVFCKSPKRFFDLDATRSPAVAAGSASGTPLGAPTVRGELTGTLLTDDGSSVARWWCDFRQTEIPVVLPMARLADNFEVVELIGVQVRLEQAEREYVIDLQAGGGSAASPTAVAVAVERSLPGFLPVGAAITDDSPPPSGAVIASPVGRTPSAIALKVAKVVSVYGRLITPDRLAARITLDVNGTVCYALLIAPITASDHLANSNNRIQPKPSKRGATEFERNPDKARKGTIGMDRHPAGAPPLDWWNIPLLEGEEETRYGPKERDRSGRTDSGQPGAGKEPPKEVLGSGRGNGSLNSAGAPPLDWWKIPSQECRRCGGTRQVPCTPRPGRYDHTEPHLLVDCNNPQPCPNCQGDTGSPLDWWNIPPGGYEGAHYAVFPPELCIKPIKAMCPEKVCRVCGEPSRRIVEYGGGNMERDELKHERGWNQRNPKTSVAERVTSAKTLGWTDCRHHCKQCGGTGTFNEWSDNDGQDQFREVPCPECHGVSNWRPGLVLDPFGGSGTTALVATGHGRDCILIDLDERNYELALQRVGPFILERAS